MKALAFVFAALLITAPVSAQVCPGFPARGAQIIDVLAPRYPGGTLSGTDDQRRDLTRAIIEQMVYEMPADGWMWKSADPTRPPSKDSIARLVGGRLCNYDWQSGATRLRQVQPGQIGDDITGQNPIPVAAVNHLTDAPPYTPPYTPVPMPPYTPVPAPGPDLSGLARYDQVERIYLDLSARAQLLSMQLAAEQVRIDALAAQLKKHDEEPMWVMKFIGNRYTQLFMTAAGVLGARELTK